MQALPEKYKFPKHSLNYYHDPQTGHLKMKENFEKDQELERQRDKELMKEITKHKI